MLVLALLSGGVWAAGAPPVPPPVQTPVASPAPRPQLPNFDGWRKTASVEATTFGWGLPQSEATVMNELGLQWIERATYQWGARTMHVQGYRFGDAGGAYGAFTFDRPADFHAFDLGQPNASAAAGDTAMIFTRGVWLIRVQMDRVSATTASQMRQLAKRLNSTAGSGQLPELLYNLPRKGLLAGSLHFVRGPAGFAAVCDWIAPAALGFNMDAEAMIASYDMGGGDRSGDTAQMVLLSYPTPQLARTYLAQLQRQASAAGFQIRRTGPVLVLVHTASPAGGARAAQLLQAFQWDAEITMVPPVPETLAALPALILGIFMLCALIMSVAVVVGLLSGALWAWADKLLPRRFQRPERETYICLHLNLPGGDNFRANPRDAT